MSTDSGELKRRTKQFAHRCVNLALALPKTDLGNHIRGQLFRCSTSVASNYRAGCLAQSRAAFVSRISIVVEEVDEAAFWLEFVIDERLLPGPRVEPLFNESVELRSIFVSSRLTASQRGARNQEKH